MTNPSSKWDPISDTVGQMRAYKNAYPCLCRHGYIYTWVERLPALIQFNSIRAMALSKENSNKTKMILLCFQTSSCSFPSSEVALQLPKQRSCSLEPTWVQILCAAPICLPKHIVNALKSACKACKVSQSACKEKCSLLFKWAPLPKAR